MPKSSIGLQKVCIQQLKEELMFFKCFASGRFYSYRCGIPPDLTIIDFQRSTLEVSEDCLWVAMRACHQEVAAANPISATMSLF